MATIDTNMSLVMIDPSEPLELYDGTIIKGRLEWFLYALCCLDYGNLPTPLSRIEEWANALITNELPNMEPQSRAEEFFKAILTGDTSNLPTPQSRSEVLLDKLARGENDFTNVEKIQSRYEFLLAYLIKNGGGIGNGGIGNIDYVLYKFQKEVETLYNTKERPVKSAILKGQTLVNVLGDYPEQTFTLDNTWQQRNIPLNYTNLIKPSTTYTFVFNVTECQMADSTQSNFQIGDDHVFNDTVNLNLKLGINTYKLTTQDSITFPLRLYGSARNSGTLTFNLMLLEGDYVGQNIPHFTGMQSVKMPVLTSVSSTNLYVMDELLEEKVIIYTFENSSTDFINVYPNEKIFFSTHRDYNYARFYDENKQPIGDYIMIAGWNPTDGHFGKSMSIVPENGRYLKVFIRVNRNWEKLTMVNRGEDYLPYEKGRPYKSNILSCLESVELGSVGEVKDELNLLTQQLTQRTETRPYQEGDELNSEFVTDMTNTQYKLAQEVVKTVDLTIVDQGGATIPKLNTFDKITHVNVSATDILPEVEMEVATTIGEDLSGTLYSSMEDIEPKQEVLKELNNAQTESVNSTMMATTEIYESLL